MSKFKKSVAQLAKELRNALKRNFLSEDGKALAEAIGEVIAEAENSEEEVSAEELDKRIKAAIEALKPEEKKPEETAEEVTETENFKLAVNRILSENATTKGAKGSSYLASANAVKDFAKTIHISASGEEFRENWKAVLSKNGVTGMAYPEQVEAGINTAWANANGLFMALRYVSPREFRIMYSAADTKDQLAHGHKVGASKKEQVIPAQGKKLSLQMIYKWLPVNRLDMQAMEQPEVFVQWVTTELTERLLYTIERTIVAGDPNATVTADAITCFESIGTKTAADAFTLYYGVNTSTTAAKVTDLYKTLITAALEIRNNGRDTWLFINKTDLGALLTADFNVTGVPIGAGLDTLAARLGVAKVVAVDYLAGSLTKVGDAGTAAVFITPDLYYRIGGDLFGDTWTIFEKNQQGYMAEVATGGGIAGLESTAVIAATSK